MSKRAVIAVDIQNDYFDQGRFPLIGMDHAAANARRVRTVRVTQPLE